LKARKKILLLQTRNIQFPVKTGMRGGGLHRQQAEVGRLKGQKIGMMVRGCGNVPGQPRSKREKRGKVHPIQARSLGVVTVPRETACDRMEGPKGVSIVMMIYNVKQNSRKFGIKIAKAVNIKLGKNAIKITHQNWKVGKLGA
jgi:hypothetical protein